MQAIPFEVDLGTSSVQGIVRLEKTHLVVEWRTFNLFGAPKDELAAIEVPYDQLDSVECEKRLGGARLVIMARSAASFGRFPLAQGTITTLKANVKRKHKSDAEVLAAEATLRIAESDSRELLDE